MRTLFIDFDGTLTNDRYWQSLPYAQHEQVQELLFRKDKTRVSDWMRGKYTAEEINQYVADNTGIPYDELWGVFISDCQSMDVDRNLLEKIKNLSGSFTTVLITGNMDSFTRFTVPSLELGKYFDYISNSYYEKIHKTDEHGKLFVDWAKKLNASLSQSVLIDDNEICCRIFTLLGGESKLTSGPANTIELLNSL